ncbi:MAG: hypothetical protein J6A77_06420 [Lachnospiraceae bacterium]|nr:hypothetical protein [Lachnospiraceae bacterium]
MEDRCDKTPGLGELCAVNIPVQMVAVSDRDGRLTPIWFRFEAEDHHIEKVVIEKTISRDECMFVGIREKRFICSAVIGDERRIMEIRYHVDNQKWRIFQFLS